LHATLVQRIPLAHFSMQSVVPSAPILMRGFALQKYNLPKIRLLAGT
jgi:hypothetical protein